MIVCFEVILHHYIIIVLVVNRFDNILFLLEIRSCLITFEVREPVRCQARLLKLLYMRSSYIHHYSEFNL